MPSNSFTALPLIAISWALSLSYDITVYTYPTSFLKVIPSIGFLSNVMAWGPASKSHVIINRNPFLSILVHLSHQEDMLAKPIRAS